MAKKKATKKAAAVLSPPEPEPIRSVTPRVSSTDALYAFVAWLDTSPNRVYTVGGAKDSGSIMGALGRFCTENELPPRSEDWQDKCKYPTHFI
jgi:hypothetical protein